MIPILSKLTGKYKSSSRTNALETFAAIDLGSNSFHMIVARCQDGELHIVDRIKEMVRLSAGLDDNNNLTQVAQQSALDCLRRFGQRVSTLPEGNLRAVGTNTLRSAHNSADFIDLASTALGHPIDVISGMEEARLVYLGVAHGTATDRNNRLVVDIGGGSTEVIIGEGFAPLCMESLYMGCVSMTRRYFGNGKITADAIKQAEIAVRVELEPIAKMYKRVGWKLAIGSSGTARAIHSVIVSAGWSKEGITIESLKQLVQKLLTFGSIENIQLEGLSEKRRPVFVGGVMVLMGIFKALKIDYMEVSDHALREGLLHDLLGRFHHEDVRMRSVNSLAKRFNADFEQSTQIQGTVELFSLHITQVIDMNEKDCRQWLSWAALLHEIGLSIAHSHYHKHGAYLVKNTDLSGFSQQEQAVLATMIRYHRRKIDKSAFKELPKFWRSRALYLTIVFRIIILMHRSREIGHLGKVEIETELNSMKLVFPTNWLENHALTQADLTLEARILKGVGFTLNIQ